MTMQWKNDNQLTVELLFASLAGQPRQLTSLLVDDRVANVALFHTFVLPVEVPLPEEDSVVKPPVLMCQVDGQLLYNLARLKLASDVLSGVNFDCAKRVV